MSWKFTPAAIEVRRYLYAQFLEFGRSPNVERITRDTGLARSAVREALLELERGVMVMIERDTDGVLIKCPPWANIPTPHVIEIDGRQAGYAGCAFEAVNACYVYAGKLVAIRSSCPHCAEPITIAFRDNRLVDFAPGDTVVHIGINPKLWAENWVAACANNNFFPSVGHVQAWEDEHPEFAGAALPLSRARELPSYENRLDYDRGADVGGGDIMLEHLRKLVRVPEAWE
jgi:hypothetical protein